MIIEHLQIEGFGALSGEFRFPAGLSVVCAPNEAGKTTLSAALLSLLYGTRAVVGRRRQSTGDERRYRPFSGGTYAMGGMLALRSGHRLNIWRDFGSDLFRAVDLSSGKDVSAEYSRAPNGDILGQKLLGLSRTQYEKIAYIRQDEAARERDFAEFSDTLSLMFASEDGQGGTIQQALNALEQALTRYDGVMGKGAIRVDTEIARVRKRLQEVEEQLFRYEQERERTEAAFAEVAGQAERADALAREVQRNEYLSALARGRELQDARAARLRARENIGKLNLQILELTPLRELDFSRGEELSTSAAILRDREDKIAAGLTKLGQAQAAQQLLTRRLAEMGNLAHADAEIARRMDLAFSKLGELERREASARIDLQSAASALRVEGGVPEDAAAYYQWLDGLPEGDRRFLSEYPDKAALAEKGLALLGAKRAELERDRNALEARRLGTFRTQRAYLFVWLGFFLAGVAAFFALDMLLFMAVPPVLCIGFGIWCLVKMAGADKLGQDEEGRIVREFAELFAREEAIDGQRRELAARHLTLAALYPAGADEFTRISGMLGGCRTAAEAWRQRRERLRELQVSACEQAGELLGFIRDFAPPALAATASVEATDLPAVLERARRLQFELKEAFSVQQQLARTTAELQQLQDEAEQLERERQENRQRLDSILREADIAVGQDPAQALSLYRENAARQRRLRELEEQTLPAAMEAAGDEGSLNALEGDLLALQERLRQLREAQPWLQTLQAELPVMDYEARARAARARMQDDGQALAERERAMALELERYQEQVPALLEEQVTLRAALNRAERYARAMTLASETMAGVAAELHARWSPMLAEELAGIVRRFSERWRFTLSRDLRLGVNGGGAPLDEEGLALHLSAGMRDQAYLALRLLLARKLGGKEPLPLILDDPFVNADDNRFREGMAYLLELSKENQIIVFSCHESRHRALATGDSRFAEVFLPLP